MGNIQLTLFTFGKRFDMNNSAMAKKYARVNPSADEFCKFQLKLNQCSNLFVVHEVLLYVYESSGEFDSIMPKCNYRITSTVDFCQMITGASYLVKKENSKQYFNFNFYYKFDQFTYLEDESIIMPALTNGKLPAFLMKCTYSRKEHHRMVRREARRCGEGGDEFSSDQLDAQAERKKQSDDSRRRLEGTFADLRSVFVVPNCSTTMGFQ
ncbi:hypothetical protein T4C_4814 [Trichinella pseudospiralis]|uniref:Uncharacterized protein n=1 Tax=Trichinella pseudospiralis TaxID=6337 RepID=A0A0V1JTD9_TRIPS|nr:hypothetical protein T4C_4814 [Trichinella pseudospiralis]